jgi:hypothetical protein
MQINLPIVFTFTRHRWNSTAFSLTRVNIKYNLHTVSLPLTSRNILFKKSILTKAEEAEHRLQKVYKTRI